MYSKTDFIHFVGRTSMMFAVSKWPRQDHTHNNKLILCITGSVAECVVSSCMSETTHHRQTISPTNIQMWVRKSHKISRDQMLVLTGKKLWRHKDVYNNHWTFWSARAVVLSSVFWIPLHVSINSLSDWLHIIFRMCSHLLWYLAKTFQQD